MAEHYNIVDTIRERNNFPSFERLFKLVKEEEPSITRKFVKTFLEEKKEVQVLRQKVKTQHQGALVASFPNEIWQMDIFILEKYFESNNGFKYILACVDIFTRKAYCMPLKRKTSDAVATGLRVIIMENKVKPRVLMTDNDGAYHGQEFLQLLKDEEISFQENIVGDHNALGIIDSFAKRIKVILTKIFLRTYNSKWINKINEIVNVYNNTPHSSIAEIKPNDADKPENIKIVQEINQQKQFLNLITSDLEAGDKVRKYIINKFNKHTEGLWSDEVFEVIRVKGMTIYVKDDSGHEYAFKRSSLLKVPRNTQSTPVNIIRTTKKYTG